jgi:ATP-binding cassette subfamily F protein 3
MIQLSGAGKRFGSKLLFENLNWLITPKDPLRPPQRAGFGEAKLVPVRRTH